MLCLSDIRLFSLLLCKMAPRCVRKGHGSVPVSRKEGLRSRSVWLSTSSLASLAMVSLSDTFICSVSLLCHCLWSGLSLTKPQRCSLAPQLLWVSRTPLRFCLGFPTIPGQVLLFAPHHHRPSCRPPSLQLSCVLNLYSHRGMWKLLGPTHVSTKPAATQKNQTPSAKRAAPPNSTLM